MVSTSSRMSCVAARYSDLGLKSRHLFSLRCRLQTEALTKALHWAADLGNPKHREATNLMLALFQRRRRLARLHGSKPIPPT